MNSVESNNLSLKYQKFTPSGFKDLDISKLDFVVVLEMSQLGLMLQHTGDTGNKHTLITSRFFLKIHVLKSPTCLNTVDT